MTALEVSHISKTYRRRRRATTRAVDDVSFSVDQSRTLAIVGESGAGKSTVARIVTGLVRPDTGSVELNGTEIQGLSRRKMRPHRRHIQMIFQDPFSSLNPKMTVGAALGEPMKIHLGLNRADRQRAAVDLLDRVGLGPDLVQRYPQQLSGGQLQRVAIARAISLGPRVLVCDEPVAALDVSVRAQVLNLLLDLQDEDGLAIVYVTHDLATLQVFAHDIIVMRDGKVVEEGPVREVCSSPSDAYTRELLAAVPSAIPKGARQRLPLSAT